MLTWQGAIALNRKTFINQPASPFLAQPVTAVLGLLVIVGVEVDVVDDDDVGGGQVDAQAPSARGQQEDEDGGVFVELVNQALPATTHNTM
jgi:hypothetical protein